MNKKLIYSLIAGTLFTLTSCDDFLDLIDGVIHILHRRHVAECEANGAVNQLHGNSQRRQHVGRLQGF